MLDLILYDRTPPMHNICYNIYIMYTSSHQITYLYIIYYQMALILLYTLVENSCNLQKCYKLPEPADVYEESP